MIFAERRKTGHFDLEAIEMAMRTAMHQAGACALTELLQFAAPAADRQSIPCRCGQQAEYLGLRSKDVLTAVGNVSLLRPYYLCSHCHNGQFPVDVELDVENTELSPGVRRMEAVLGQDASFDKGRQRMKLLANLDVTTKSVERTAEAIGADIAARQQVQLQRAMQLDLPIVVGDPIPILYVQMDGTGVPVVNRETVGRAGKTEGQPAHTREVKLGAVFTQTSWDPKGYAIRDPESTTYVGAIETAEEFGKRIYWEAWRRGWSLALLKVVMGDGSEWIWNLAQIYFPGAFQILDLRHAHQHLWDLVRLLHPNDAPAQKRWILVHQDWLDRGKIKKLVTALRSFEASCCGDVADKFRTEAEYFRRNAMRMRYPKFRRLHLFVGTGVIEAGCKTVIGSRCKQSGMFWTVRGANAILALRFCYLNGQFEDYWETRRSALPAA